MSFRENFRLSFRENLIQPGQISATTRENKFPPVKMIGELHPWKIVSTRESGKFTPWKTNLWAARPSPAPRPQFSKTPSKKC